MNKKMLLMAALSAFLWHDNVAGQTKNPSSVNDNAQSQSAVARNPFSADRDKLSLPAAPVFSADTTRSQNTRVSLNLREGELLSQQLTTWAETNGYKLLWNSSHDYVIFKSIYINETNVESVLERLGQLFISEYYGLVIKNFQKNNVLIIDEQ